MINGYPGEGPYNGNRMYTRHGRFDLIEAILILGDWKWWGYELGYFGWSYGGTSGSGAVKSGKRICRQLRMVGCCATYEEKTQDYQTRDR